MAVLEVKNIGKHFGSTKVLDDVSFDLEEGNALAIIGSSGSGKTTLLRCLNFLEMPDHGSITVRGETLFDADRPVKGQEKDLRTKRLHFGMVFQAFHLFPQYTALENVTLAEKLLAKERPDFKQNRKQIFEEIEAHGKALLEQMGLAERMEHYPHQLSGGQQQRVALARALVVEPSVLLFDEPLSNLDAKLRVSMRTEIRNIQQRVGITAVYVTHDQSEAMALSDQIIIMNKGVVAQIGTPQEIYYRPKDAFVANFIGEANFLQGKLVSREGNKGVMRIYDHQVEVENVEDFAQDENCTLVLRPESATIETEGQLPCEVIMSCFMGSYQHYHVKVGDVVVQITDFNPRYKKIFQVGDRAYVKFNACDSHLLKIE